MNKRKFTRIYDDCPPYAQGFCDGTCGIYALLNAVSYLLNLTYDTGVEELHRYLIKNVNAKTVMLDGISWWALGHLAERACRNYADRVTFKREFWNKETPDDAGEFLDLLGEALASHRKAIAVIGLNKPEPHWSAITSANFATVNFFDSTYIPPKVSGTSVGTATQDQDREYVICPHQVLLFHQIEEKGFKHKKQKVEIRDWPGEDPHLQRY